jgi:exodeoxyribonuclease-3
LRIASFNCNSIRSRLGQILAWLEEHRPDVLMLQETKVADDAFPAAAIEAAGWQVRFAGEKRYNGVAMISRQAPDACESGFDGDEASRSRLLRARMGDLHLLNAYVPQGRALDSEHFAFKLDWLARLRGLLEASYDPAGDRVLLVGDLNIAPEPIDVYDHERIWPHVVHGPRTTEVYNALRDWGLRDLFREKLPDAGRYTFWDYRLPESLGRNLGWRIDHLLATAELADACTAVTVDIAARAAERPSDHTFVTADFEI